MDPLLSVGWCAMQLMDLAEAAEQLGITALEGNLVMKGEVLTSKTYFLPAPAVDLTIISRLIGE
jgi:hypothetical protein